MTTFDIPKEYKNYGDLEWSRYGGLFVKHCWDNIYHVVEYCDVSSLVEEDTYIRVDSAYIDISDCMLWNWSLLLEDSGMEDSIDQVSDDLKAIVVFENIGAFNLGKRRQFHNKDKALQKLKLLVNT